MLLAVAWAGRRGGDFQAWNEGFTIGTFLAAAQGIYFWRKKFDFDPFVIGMNAFLLTGFLAFQFKLNPVLLVYDVLREATSIAFIAVTGIVYTAASAQGFIGVAGIRPRRKSLLSILLILCCVGGVAFSYFFKGDRLLSTTLPFFLLFGARKLLRSHAKSTVV